MQRRHKGQKEWGGGILREISGSFAISWDRLPVEGGGVGFLLWAGVRSGEAVGWMTRT